MKKLFLILCSLLPFFQQKIVAQIFFNISNSPLDTIVCNDNCVDLFAEHLDIRRTTSYSSVPISYAPYTMSVGTGLTLQDDKFSGPVPIGFDFCFYGNSYSVLYPSSNGQITFNSIYANGNCSFETQQPLPYYNAKYPDNAIFSPFVDFDISLGGTVTYTTIGTAPFRKFIIEYNNIPYFGSLCTSGVCNYQCVLNETYNSIDIFISNKTLCNSNPLLWLNYATIGVQSIGASSYYAVPNRNASIWTATNEGILIFPNGDKATQVDWYDEWNNLIQANTDTLSFCSNFFPRTVHAQINYLCPAISFWDTINLIKLFPVIDSMPINKTSCKNTIDGILTIFASAIYPPINFSVDYSTPSSNNVYNPLSYGWHYVIVTDDHGCKDSEYVFINTVSTLALNLISMTYPICPNNSGSICVQASGGVPPYSYVWNTGDTTQCIYNLFSGAYSCTVTDMAGCEEETTVGLPALNIPVATAQITKPVCHQNGAIDLTVSGGTPPYTYGWSTGAITQDISGLISSGYYWVTIYDAVGCSNSYVYYLEDTLLTKVELSIENYTTCGFNTGIIKAIGWDATPPYTYLWSNGGINNIDSNVSSGIYLCTATDANGCSNTSTIIIPPSYPLDLHLYPANAHCDVLNNGLINAVVLNATCAVHYLWSTGDTTVGINSLTPNTYSLSVIDSLGCVDTSSAIIYDDGSPHLILINFSPPLCYGDSSGAVTFSGVGGASPYKYSYDGLLFYTTSLITNVSAGTLTVYIRDANSCLRDTIINFYQPPPLYIDSIISDSLICFHDEVSGFSVHAGGGVPPYTYSQNGGGWQTSNSFAGLPQGNYLIEIKDSNGCIASMNYTLTFIYPPEVLEIDLQKKDVECYLTNTGEIIASITGGWPPYIFSWSHSAIQNLHVAQLYKGEYSLTVTDQLGCEIVDSITLLQEDCCHVYMPNSFTPNNDLINDVFRPISAKEVHDIRLQIFDRWGHQVFRSLDFNEGWNGEINNQSAESGVYFYLLDYICNLTNEKIILKGDVTLLR